MHRIFFGLLFFLYSFSAVAQKGQLNPAFDELKKEIIEADTTRNMLLTWSGLNVLLQRRALQYLTGTSDLALSKLFATYTTDNDKLNLGFNIPYYGEHSRLRWVINPILEADVAKNFSKLYEKDKWQNNIRLGAKFTYLFGNGTLNFWDKDADKFLADTKKRNKALYRKQDFVLLRKKQFDKLKKEVDDAEAEKGITAKSLNGDDAVTPEPDALSPRELKKRKRKLFEDLGVAEADYLEKERAYTRFQTNWISIWGFLPATPAEYWVSNGRPAPFVPTRYHFREINLQYTHLHDFEKWGTVFGSIWLRNFNNNSVNAELLATTDFNQYFQYPNIGDTLNYSQLGTKKGYVGSFSEFITNTLFLQGVYTVPFQWSVKPGISVRYEKNYGEYSAVNWRLGLPITIQGKDKPVTVELQYRLDDVNNYRKETDHKVKHTVGINLGVPIVALYK